MQILQSERNMLLHIAEVISHKGMTRCLTLTHKTDSNWSQDQATKKSSYKEHRVDAKAPYADEGRGKLRKAAGSCKQAFNPQISEWGNPARVMPGHHVLNP